MLYRNLCAPFKMILELENIVSYIYPFKETMLMILISILVLCLFHFYSIAIKAINDYIIDQLW